MSALCPECLEKAKLRTDLPEAGLEDRANYRHKGSLRGLIEALQIIEKHTEHGNLDVDRYHAEHDQLWAGDYESTAAKMTEEERARLEELGWFEDEESWSTFC